MRLMQMRIFNCSERKGVLFPVSRGFGIESYQDILCPIDSKKRIIGTEWMVKESIPIGCRQKSKTPFGENIVGVQIDIFTNPSVSISF